MQWDSWDALLVRCVPGLQWLHTKLLLNFPSLLYLTLWSCSHSQCWGCSGLSTTVLWCDPGYRRFYLTNISLIFVYKIFSIFGYQDRSDWLWNYFQEGGRVFNVECLHYSGPVIPCQSVSSYHCIALLTEIPPDLCWSDCPVCAGSSQVRFLTEH